MEEVWKDVIGFEGYYQVSNLGRVKRIKSEKGAQTEKTLKEYSYPSTGYFQVNLSKDSKVTHCYIHRLVAEAFILNPENKPQVNHIDGNKHNNNIDNLEWVTNQENSVHAYDMGLKIITPELRKKLSDANSGQIPWNKGLKLPKRTPESIKKVSEAMLGRVWVCNGEHELFIHPENLQEHLDKGYIRGRHKRSHL